MTGYGKRALAILQSPHSPEDAHYRAFSALIDDVRDIGARLDALERREVVPRRDTPRCPHDPARADKPPAHVVVLESDSDAHPGGPPWFCTACCRYIDAPAPTPSPAEVATRWPITPSDALELIAAHDELEREIKALRMAAANAWVAWLDNRGVDALSAAMIDLARLLHPKEPTS